MFAFNIIFSASRRVDLPCKKEVGALCALTGIGGGWIWILIINVEGWQVLHFQRLLVNNQTLRIFLTHRPSGCIYRPSQSDISSCLSLSSQAAVSYLLCVWRKHEKRKKQSWNVEDQNFYPRKNGRHIWVWCLRVAGGEARAAAGTKSNFLLITHPRCLRRVFSNKEFDLVRYYSYANFCL